MFVERFEGGASNLSFFKKMKSRSNSVDCPARSTAEEYTRRKVKRIERNLAAEEKSVAEQVSSSWKKM